MFTPSTNLRLLSVPLESDYSNTLWFPNIEAQTTYFTGKIVKTFDDFNYIKKDNTIVVAEEIDKLYNCNYIMYKNSNFSTRWFYAFINRMEWASNGSTRLYVSTDVIQTWFFDITYYQSYVDRCHSDTDVAGDNIVPEDFTDASNGGYSQVGSIDMTPNNIWVFATATPSGTPIDGTLESGVYSGSGKVIGVVTSNISTLNTHLQNYVNNGTATAVSKIQQNTGKNGAGISFAKHPSHIDCASGNTLVSFIPKNKKLLSGAFITAYVQLYGQELEFNPEFIAGTNITGKIIDDPTSGSVGCMITNYSTGAITSLLVSATIPECTWAYNQYKNDFNLHSGSNAIYNRRSALERSTARNTASLKTAIAITDAASTTANQFSNYNLAKIALGGIGGAIGGALHSASSIASSGLNAYETAQEQKIWDYNADAITQDLTAINESYNAPATGGVASSNLYIAGAKATLSYGYKVPPLSIAQRCDKFLSVYGYKQSEYRSINLHARSNWTYIRTLGLNASGNFPDDDMKVIKQVFDKGIFFWSYTAQFGNFDQNNPIV